MAKYLVQHRRGTVEQWAAQSTIIPREGEIVIEIDEVNSLHKLKIGDGIHTYAELAYLQAGDEIITQVLAEAKPRIVTVELTENWISDPNTEGKYSQVITLDNITTRSRLDLQPNAEMLAEFKQLGLVFVTENKNGEITVYSVGNKPLKSYTMQATIVETELSVDCDGIVGIPVGSPASNIDLSGYITEDYIDNRFSAYNEDYAEDEEGNPTLAAPNVTIFTNESLDLSGTWCVSITSDSTIYLDAPSVVRRGKEIATEEYVDEKTIGYSSYKSEGHGDPSELHIGLQQTDSGSEYYTPVIEASYDTWNYGGTLDLGFSKDISISHVDDSECSINIKSDSINLSTRNGVNSVSMDSNGAFTHNGKEIATEEYVTNAISGVELSAATVDKLGGVKSINLPSTTTYLNYDFMMAGWDTYITLHCGYTYLITAEDSRLNGATLTFYAVDTATGDSLDMVEIPIGTQFVAPTLEGVTEFYSDSWNVTVDGFTDYGDEYSTNLTIQLINITAEPNVLVKADGTMVAEVRKLDGADIATVVDVKNAVEGYQGGMEYISIATRSEYAIVNEANIKLSNEVDPEVYDVGTIDLNAYYVRKNGKEIATEEYVDNAIAGIGSTGGDYATEEYVNDKTKGYEYSSQEYSGDSFGIENAKIAADGSNLNIYSEYTGIDFNDKIKFTARTASMELSNYEAEQYEPEVELNQMGSFKLENVNTATINGKEIVTEDQLSNLQKQISASIVNNVLVLS